MNESLGRTHGLRTSTVGGKEAWQHGGGETEVLVKVHGGS